MRFLKHALSMSDQKPVSALKRALRFFGEWIVPFAVAGCTVSLVVATVGILAGLSIATAVAIAVAAGLLAAVLAILIQPVRRWLVEHGYMFDFGSGWN